MENVSPEQDRIEWWRLREGLPTWKKAAKIMMAIAPSSAAAERVFWLMLAALSAQPERVLEDRLKVALMLQFNEAAVATHSSFTVDTLLQVSTVKNKQTKTPFQVTCSVADCGWGRFETFHFSTTTCN